MPRPRLHDDQLKERLLESASGMIASSGGDFALRPLAESVGTSTTAVYSLFGSRGALVEAVAMRATETLSEALDTVPSTEPLQRLLEQAMAYREFAVTSPGMFRIVFSSQNATDTVLDARDTVASPARQTIANALEQGLLQGDARRILRHLHSATHGFLLLEDTGRMGGDEEYAQLVVDMLSAHLTERGAQLLADQPLR